MITKKTISIIAVALILTGGVGALGTKKETHKNGPVNNSKEITSHQEVSILAYGTNATKDQFISLADFKIKKVNKKNIDGENKYIYANLSGSLQDSSLFLKHSVIAGDYVSRNDFYQKGDVKYMDLLAAKKNKLLFPLMFNLPKDFNKTGGVYDGLNHEEVSHLDIGDYVNVYSQLKIRAYQQKKSRIDDVEVKASEILGIKAEDKDKGAILYLAIDKNDYAKMMLLMNNDIYVTKCPIIDGRYDCAFDAYQKKYENIREIRG